MREILFRGKRKDNGEWVEGDFYRVDILCFIIPRSSSGTYSRGKYLIKDVYPCYEVIPETVGQYTGLVDKNGRKIFEGDYWLDTDCDYLVYVVEFRGGQYGFACYGQKGALMPYGFDEDAGGWGEIDFEPMTDFYIESIEIEGNIHDNPELLGGEDNENTKVY